MAPFLLHLRQFRVLLSSWFILTSGVLLGQFLQSSLVLPLYFFFVLFLSALILVKVRLFLISICVGAVQIALSVPAPGARMIGVEHQILVRSIPQVRSGGALEFRAEIFDRKSLGEYHCRVRGLPWRNSDQVQLGTIHRALLSLSQLSRGERGRRDARRGLSGRCKIHLLSTALDSFPPPLERVRRVLVDALRELYPDPVVQGIIRGMLLGEANAAGRVTAELFRSFGITHLLVVSGLHVGALYACCILCASVILSVFSLSSFGVTLFRFVPELFGLWVVWSYIVMLGFPLSGTRAAVGVTTYVLSGYLSRKSSFFERIGISCLATVSLWPGAWEELGFQLTFSALIALLSVMELARTRRVNRVEVFASFAILPSLFTSVVFVIHTGELNLLAPIGNLLFSWIIVGVGFYGGVASLALSFVQFQAGKFLATLVSGGLNFVRELLILFQFVIERYALATPIGVLVWGVSVAALLRILHRESTPLKIS
ncbi:MAG: ComEC/Rec2 family competence protein [Bdellovibrionales bacterium]|nr:ComEC/Rec2 family competence protein [Bdellovibrionales bacterium]